jgi:hypothetical protein
MTLELPAMSRVLANYWRERGCLKSYLLPAMMMKLLSVIGYLNLKAGN